MSERPSKPRGKASAVPAWSVPMAVADIPETGRRVDLVGDAATRDAVAKVSGVAALPRLQADFELTRQGHDGVRVLGRVSATVIQNCVVTLEPIENEIEEAIDLTFAPPVEAPPKAVEAAGLQALDAEDPPEALHDGIVDLGAVAVEFLLLGIDPYPRKPDAQFTAAPAGDPASHPFAALAALKKGGNPEDR
jgi:uncharacterized metal-binding protein YceD (DUF177 family)